MKFILLLILILTSWVLNPAYAQTYNKQYTYIDAVQLSELYGTKDPANSKEYYEILSKYGITHENLIDHPFFGTFRFDIFPEVLSNIIIDSTMPIGPQLHPIEHASERPMKSDPKLIPAMNWQAAAINGIATFMAGRFKQEVLHYGLENVFGQITAKDQTVIKGLFPKTYDHIHALYKDSENSYYTADLLYLKQLVHLDMANIESNFVKNYKTMFPKLEGKPNLVDGIAVGSEILSELEKQVPLDIMISRLSEISYTSDTSIMYRTMNFLDLVSMAFRADGNSDNTWVNPVTTLPVYDDPKKNRISTFFYGLMYQQLKQIPEFSDKFDVIINDTKEIADKMYEIGIVVNELNEIVETIKENNAEKFDSAKVFELIEEFLDVIDDVSDVLDQEFKLAMARVQQATGIAKDVLSIRSYVIAQNYPLALAEIASVFGQYANGSIELSRSLSFISGLAAIKTDDDMEKLLEAHALPIGSASIKRSSRFNVSINGYVGFTAGFEKAYVSSGRPQQKGNVGLTAPIGISTTFFHGRMTGFASFFDLGSVVNQRLNNDTTSYTNLRFEQFFTPGVGLFFNFKNAPISTGFQYYFIPNLRTIKYESNGAIIGESGVSVSRINLTVLVDIPFFTLYNRTTKRKKN